MFCIVIINIMLNRSNFFLILLKDNDDKFLYVNKYISYALRYDNYAFTPGSIIKNTYSYLSAII